MAEKNEVGLLKKLASVQSALKVPKDMYNSFGKYKYRSAESILEALEPLLKKNGLALKLSDEVVQIGNRFYVMATATVTDVETGLSTDVTAYAREDESKKGMDGSQVTGASSSYARKYALNGLLAIDDTKDSDATNTHGKDETVTCADCGKVIANGKKKDGSVWLAADIAQWSNRRYGRQICLDCAKAAEGR
jgi:hypothetical protein